MIQRPEQELIGVIGLGLMGTALTERLLEHGYGVAVWNRTREKAAPLLARGAEWSDNPLACCQRVLLVNVSRTKISVSEQSRGRELAQTRARFAAGEWVPVRACFRGKDLFVQVGDTRLKASDAVIGEAKTAFALLGHGEAIGFRGITVTKASD